MNKQQYVEAKRKDPSFDKKWVKLVPVKDVEYDPEESQFRANGHKTDKVTRFSERIKQDGWKSFPPGTVSIVPNGRYKAQDIMTRLLGAIEAGESFIPIELHTDSQLKTRDEWEDFQAQANDHDLASPNSDADIENHINRQVQNGALQKKLKIYLKEDHSTTPDFIEKGAKHYKEEIYKNSGHRINWFENRIKNAIGGKVIESFENYTKGGKTKGGTAVDYYTTHTGWAGSHIGDVSQGTTIYVVESSKYWYPNLIGLSIKKKMDNPGVKIDVIAYLNSLAGKTNEDIVKFRQTIKNYWDRLHAEVLNKCGLSLGNLYFLPQMKRDRLHADGSVEISKDNMNKIIKAR